MLCPRLTEFMTFSFKLFHVNLSLLSRYGIFRMSVKMIL